jgi:hypothetical protein
MLQSVGHYAQQVIQKFKLTSLVGPWNSLLTEAKESFSVPFEIILTSVLRTIIPAQLCVIAPSFNYNLMFDILTKR